MQSSISLICIGCGKSFEKKLSEYKRALRENGSSMYCSRMCAGQNIPRPRAYKKITINCPQCGKSFDTTAAKKARKCCSIKCARLTALKFRDFQNPEFKQKMSDIAKEQWATGIHTLTNIRKRRFNSEGEIELRHELQRRFPDYGFTTGMFCYDDRLNADIWSRDKKIMIEYDGIWHFKDIHGQLEKKQKRDADILDWCKKNGWKLIRIKESIYKSNKLHWQDVISNEIARGGAEIVYFY